MDTYLGYYDTTSQLILVIIPLRLRVTVCIKIFSQVTTYMYLHKESIEATFPSRKSGHGQDMIAICHELLCQIT